MHFFSRGGSPGDWVSLGFGAAALLVALASIGYVLVLGARQPLMAPSDVWNLSVCLAVRNLLTTGPLFVAEFGAAAFLLLLDPALALLGLPILLLQCLRLTAQLGFRRSERGTLTAGCFRVAGGTCITLTSTATGTCAYRRCGASGLLLPPISLGLWHNFGDSSPI